MFVSSFPVGGSLWIIPALGQPRQLPAWQTVAVSMSFSHLFLRIFELDLRKAVELGFCLVFISESLWIIPALGRPRQLPPWQTVAVSIGFCPSLTFPWDRHFRMSDCNCPHHGAPCCVKNFSIMSFVHFRPQ